MSESDDGVLAGVAVAHQRASVAEIERAAGRSQRAVVSRLLDEPTVREAFALQTCNRAEAYVLADDASAARAALADYAPEVPDGAIRRLDHEESIRHLMRVAAGLESLVVGEDQILGQFKRAVEDARAAGGVDGRLGEVLTKAAHVGERARTETAINEGTVSLGSAAVELVRWEATLTDATAMVVGAGEIGTLVARRLDDTPVSQVVVANRTVPTAEHVVAELETEGGAVSLSAARSALDRVDVVVTATGAPDHVFDPDAFAGRDVDLCVDLAQPRDVAPAATEHLALYDMDDLETVTAAARAARADAVAAVESLIDDEFDRLMESFKRDRADEAISAMYAAAETVRDEQVEQALTKLESQGELTDAQRETVESLADALVGQLLAAPTKSLREAAGSDDWETIHTAMQLFDPNFDDLDPARLPGSSGTGGVPADGPPPGVDADQLPDGVDSEQLPDELPEEMPDAIRDRLDES